MVKNMDNNLNNIEYLNENLKNLEFKIQLLEAKIVFFIIIIYLCYIIN